MQGKVTALPIFHQAKPFHDVEAALEKLAVATRRAHTLAKACHVLSWADPPVVVFTESELPDGNWADVVSFAATASSPVSVIVVGPETDTKLYASSIEAGAFDFIAPPFKRLIWRTWFAAQPTTPRGSVKRARMQDRSGRLLLPFAVKNWVSG